MIQCENCEYFNRGPDGRLNFRCDPFGTVKEPECLLKWQMLKQDLMVQAYQATLAMYKRIAPMQEKLIRHMEREVDEMDEVDGWKHQDDDSSDLLDDDELDADRG